MIIFESKNATIRLHGVVWGRQDMIVMYNIAISLADVQISQK